MSENRYAFWSKAIYIERATLLRSRLVIENDTENSLLINKSAESILLAFDGTKTYEQCIKTLAEQYLDSYDNIDSMVSQYLKELVQYQLELVYISLPEKHECPVIGEITFFPHVASIEITELCNVRCRHCYGNFSSEKKDFLSLEDAKHLLDDLSNAGIQTLELTGGEVTTHPNADEIVEYACNLNFSKINILTNAVSLKDSLLTIFEKYKDKVFVQVDLHSLSDEYLHWFMQAEVCSKKIQTAIQSLKTRKIRFRIVSMITRKNVLEIPAIADYVHGTGVTWTPSIVEPVGRACYQDDNSDLYLKQKDWDDYIKGIQYCITNYPELTASRPKESVANDNNCGVLTEHVVIDCRGNIKLCTMDDGTIVNAGLGNLLEKKLHELFVENEDFIKAVILQKVPKRESAECNGCDCLQSCAGCLYRTIINAKRKKDECKWYSNNMNPIIQRHFSK